MGYSLAHLKELVNKRIEADNEILGANLFKLSLKYLAILLFLSPAKMRDGYQRSAGSQRESISISWRSKELCGHRLCSCTGYHVQVPWEKNGEISHVQRKCS